MQSIKPQKIQVRDRVLDVCSHGECRSHRIWDYQTCWIHLTEAERKDLRERLYSSLRSSGNLSKIVLTGADLKNFDFTQANLSQAFLNGCNLQSCKFIDANLNKAFLGGANLVDADLTRVRMQGTVLTGASLEGIRLLAYSIRMKPVNLCMENFGKNSLLSRPHLNEQEPYFAEASYRSLKAYFSADGEYDSASWAAYCERLMQRKVFWERKYYFQWLISFLFSVTCGYGEKPLRSFFASVVIVILYALLYKVFGLIILTTGAGIKFIDAMSFSFATFCGFSLPDLVPQGNSMARLLTTTEAFLGIFALGLFIFTLTKRYVAR